MSITPPAPAAPPTGPDRMRLREANRAAARIDSTHTLLRMLSVSYPAPDERDPDDPQPVTAHTFAGDVARIWEVSAPVVMALLPTPPIRLTEDAERDGVIRLLACRPSLAEARAWAATPPTDEQVAVLISLKGITLDGSP